jgi:hypothetical protein
MRANVVVEDCGGGDCVCVVRVLRKDEDGRQIFVTARKEQNKNTLALGCSEVD